MSFHFCFGQGDYEKTASWHRFYCIYTRQSVASGDGVVGWEDGNNQAWWRSIIQRGLFFCHLKNSRITLTKHSNSPTPHLLEKSSPLPTSVFMDFSQITAFQTHMCVCAVIWVFVDGRGLVQFTETLWRSCHERGSQLDPLRKRYRTFWRGNPAACVRRTWMYGSDTATLVDWSLMQQSH